MCGATGHGAGGMCRRSVVSCYCRRAAPDVPQ